MKKRLIVFALVFVLVLTCFIGCASKTVEQPKEQGNTPSSDESADATSANAEPGPGEGGILRIGIWSSPGGVFMPSFTENTYDSYVSDIVFDSLLIQNSNYEFEPNLAESWTCSDNGKEFTFVLKDGIKWHDGEPLTVEDVKFSFEFLADPDYSGARGSYVKEIKGVEDFTNGKTERLEGVQIIDEKTIKIITTDVFSSGELRYGTNVYIIPKHIWEDVDITNEANYSELLKNPIGTGAFKMGEFVPDQHVVLVGNTDYRDGQPKLDKIVFVVSNQETAQAQMINGELDFIYLSKLNKDDIEIYESNNITVFTTPYNAYQYMAINHVNEVFQDKRVRQAFMYAIDRQAIVNDLLEGFGSVATDPYPAEFWAHAEDGNQYARDSQKAIDLLIEAGWEYKDGKMYNNGKQVKFVLKYPSGNKVRELCAPLIQQNFKEIGIELELQIMEFATLYDQCKKGDYDLALLGQGAEMDGDLSKMYHSKNIKPVGTVASNLIRYTNPEIDKICEKGLSTTKQEDRIPIYKAFSKLLNEEVPVVFTYHWDAGEAVTNKLMNYTSPSYRAYAYYHMNEWYMSE